MKIISIIERLCVHFKVESNKELAEILGISATTISNWKTRNTIDYQLIISKCQNADLNWLFFGDDSHFENSANDYNQNVNKIKESDFDYSEKLKECSNCKDKDRIIDSQQAHIDTLQRELHRCQSKLDDYENEAPPGQKRKVG